MSSPSLAEFVAEAREHLANVCDHLLNLERGAPEELAERRAGLLRAMHSVKGGAGFFGRKAIERLAHAAESALEGLPAERLAGNAPAVDALLAAVDRIAALLDDVERSDEWDVSDVVGRLEALAAAAPAAAPAASATPSPSSQGARAVLAAPLQEHAIRIDLWKCWMQHGVAPADVVAALERHGALSDGALAAEGDLDAPGPAGTLVFTARLATLLTADELIHDFGAWGLTIDSGEPLLATPVSVAVSASVSVASPAIVTPSPPIAKAEPARPLEPPAAVDRATSIRIPVSLVDRLMALAGELVLVRNQTRRAVEAQEPLPRLTAARLHSVTAEFQEAVLQTRMQPVANLFAKFPRLVRDLGRQLGKEIQLELMGGDVELDKTILDALSDPLVHLVRNCCDHGLETPDERERAGKPGAGKLTLAAQQQGDEITLTIADDGRGIDRRRVREHALRQGIRTSAELDRLADSDLLGLILLPGFSTAKQVSDLSGRGVGMDVVRTNLQQIGGRVEIESVPGQGASFRLRLPLTLAIIPALLVSCRGQTLAVPQKDLEQLVLVRPGDKRLRLEATLGQPVLRLRGKLLPVANLAATLGLAPDQALDPAQPTLCAVVRAGGRRYALAVDAVEKSEEIVVKPMHEALRQLDVYSGATILGDGQVALILDCDGLARQAGLRLELETAAEPVAAPATVEPRERVLLLEHAAERFAVPLRSIRRIVWLEPATVQQLGRRAFAAIDGVPTQLLHVGDLTDAAPAADRSRETFALLPRHAPTPVGLLVSRLLDTAEAERAEPGSSAAAVTNAMVDRQVTRLVDLDFLAGFAADASSLNAAPSSSAHILLVEDTRFFRELVRGYLEAAGHRVTEAHHGQAGLAALEQGTFDLVISDLEMPELDGWNFARRARALLGGRPLPMLALSTLEGTADRERALASGFDEYQVKLNRESLLAAVARLLGASANRSAPHAG